MTNYLRTIQLLQNKPTENKSQIEELISLNLDECLENFGQQLFTDLPITSLYNIMNNKRRNLTQHDLCYNLIKQIYEQNRILNIFILLPSLDGECLSDSNLEDSILSQDERCGFIVNIKSSYLLDRKKKIDQYKNEQRMIFKQMQQQISEFDQYKNEQRMIIQQMQQQISELKNSLPNKEHGEPGQIAVLNQQKNGYTWQISPFSIYFKASLNNNSKSYQLYKGFNGSVIPLDKIINDSNNAFDINAHAYRVPVAGKWLFFGQLFHWADVKNGYIVVAILKNGEVFGEIGHYRDIKRYDTMSCSSEIDCQVGDLIYLYTYCVSEYHANGTFLQGFYLSP